MKEIWKEVENYPNYQISSFGNIKSLNYRNTGVSKFLACELDKKYYQKSMQRINIHMSQTKLF